MITRLKLIAATLFWGGTFVAARLLGPSLPPQVSAAARFVLASAFMMAIAHTLEGGLPRLDRRMLMVTALLGFLGIFAYNSFFFAALQLLPASRSAIIVSTSPALTALLTALILRQQLSALRWLGIGISFTGVLVVISHGHFAQILQGALGRGELLMFGGVLSWALYTVISQRVLTGLTPIAATTYASLWGVAFLLLAALPVVSQIHWAAIDFATVLSIAYIAIPGTGIAYIWYFDGVKRLGAPRTAVFNNFVPVFGVAFSTVLLHEQLLPSTVLGGALVLAGVILTNRSS